MEKASYDPGTPCWTDLSTPDLDGAARFYGGLFGWELEDMGEETGHYHQATVRGLRVAGLAPAQPGGPPNAFWTTYLAGADADAHAAAVTAGGGTVAYGPMDVFSEGRMLVAQDPAGAMFGVWEPRAHSGAQLVNEHGTLTWNELMTPDLDGATAFYGSLFDYAFDDLPELPGGGYKLLRLGEDVVGGLYGTEDEPPNWTVYFQHDEVDAGLERARELGGRVAADPVDSAYGRWAVVQDPQGGSFRMIQSASPA